jgi:hypothetical protein
MTGSMGGAATSASSAIANADLVVSALKRPLPSYLHAFVAKVPSQAWNALSEEQQTSLVRQAVAPHSLKWFKVAPTRSLEWQIVQAMPTAVHERAHTLISDEISFVLRGAVGFVIQREGSPGA